MAQDTSIPAPDVVLDLLWAFRRSKTMFAAVSLGVFEKLSNGPASLAELAQATACQVDSLERLLDACVGLELLSKSPHGYANTPAAQTYLTQQSPRRLTGYVNFSNDFIWKLWTHLDDAVREGTDRWQQAFGWDGPIFSHFFKTEDAKREFLMGMHGFGCISSPRVVEAFDLSQFSTFVDLGGATGHLAIAACERYPNLKGIVFDLPDARALAQEIVNQSRVRDRISLVSGDFFSDPLPQADLFALGRIVHDWSIDKIDRLLKRVYEALPSGGAILLAEKILWEDKTGPLWSQMQSLNMLTCTEGKERTLQEYEELLEKPGFVRVAGFRTEAPLDAVIAFKP